MFYSFNTNNMKDSENNKNDERKIRNLESEIKQLRKENIKSGKHRKRKIYRKLNQLKNQSSLSNSKIFVSAKNCQRKLKIIELTSAIV